jgi:hypothetical protein
MPCFGAIAMSTPPPSDRRIDADELSAVVVALAAMGTILAWGLRRAGSVFTWSAIAPVVSLAPDASPSPRLPVGADPAPTVQPTPGDPEATRVPEEDPRVRRSPRPRVLVSPTPDPAAVVPVPAPTAPTATVEPTFPDVSTDYWAYPFIAGLASRGMVQGLQDGTFQPEEPTTRAQFASAIQNTFDLGAYRERIPFSDVPANYPANPAIDAAVRSRFMSGYPNQTFQPDQPISRLEMLLSLFSGMQLPPPENTAEVLSVYPDAAAIPDYATAAIAAATQANLVVLPPGQTELQLNRTATRAEVASTLYQALVFQGMADPASAEVVIP